MVIIIGILFYIGLATLVLSILFRFMGDKFFSEEQADHIADKMLKLAINYTLVIFMVNLIYDGDRIYELIFIVVMAVAINVRMDSAIRKKRTAK